MAHEGQGNLLEDGRYLPRHSLDFHLKSLNRLRVLSPSIPHILSRFLVVTPCVGVQYCGNASGSCSFQYSMKNGTRDARAKSVAKLPRPPSLPILFGVAVQHLASFEIVQGDKYILKLDSFAHRHGHRRLRNSEEHRSRESIETDPSTTLSSPLLLLLPPRCSSAMCLAPEPSQPQDSPHVRSEAKGVEHGEQVE